MSPDTDLRSHARKSYEEAGDAFFLTIEVQDASNMRLKVKVIDFSSGGIGVESVQELQVGQQITFIENIPEENARNTGVVMWTMCSKDGCRAGVKFT